MINVQMLGILRIQENSWGKKFSFNFEFAQLFFRLVGYV